MKELIGDRQIVQLGEQSHGDGTCFTNKIRLIKFLHREMGFDVLSFESGLYDCHRAWQAFRSGEAPMSAARQGVFGIWTGSSQTAPLWEYLSDQASGDSPLELAGFDCQFTATASRELLIKDIQQLISDFEIEDILESELNSFFDQLSSLINFQDTDDDEKATFDTTLALLEEAMTERMGGEELTPDKVRRLGFWEQEFKNIGAYASYRWGAKSAASRGTILSRDKQMAENLIWQADNYFKDRKIIVWAASFHIARNLPELEVPGGGIQYDGMVQMGHRVHQALGDRAFTVGFTAYEGIAGAFHRPKFQIGTAPAGTLEDICVQADLQNALIPLSGKSVPPWHEQKLFCRPLGYTWMQGKWQRHFDAMIFNRTMAPSTR